MKNCSGEENWRKWGHNGHITIFRKLKYSFTPSSLSTSLLGYRAVFHESGISQNIVFWGY